MTAKELVEALYVRFDGHISRKRIARVLESATALIVENVPKAPVHFPKLGVFRSRPRKGMTVIAPNGTRHLVEDWNELKFRAFKVNRKVG